MKIIKIISVIAMSYFLSGCMTSSLLDTIKTESAPTTEVWKTDEIKSIKPSTTTSGEKTWTFVGEDNNYQLDIKDDNINTTTRNFVTLLNNPHIDKRIIELSNFPNSFTVLPIVKKGTNKMSFIASALQILATVISL